MGYTALVVTKLTDETLVRHGWCGSIRSQPRKRFDVDHDTLAEGVKLGRSALEDDTRVSAETSRRYSCDAGFLRRLPS